MKKQNVGFSCNQASQHTNNIEQKYKRYFSMNDVYFREGIDYAFIGNLRYALSTPARLVDDVLLVAWDDIRMIYGGKFQFSQHTNQYVMTQDAISASLSPNQKILVAQNGTSREIDEIPLVVDGVFMVPIEGLMVLAFQKQAKWMRSYLLPGDYLGISDDGRMFPTVQFLKDLLIYSTKKVVILREMYYYQRAGVLEPYRLYVPSYYNPEKKYPLIVWLHGAWPNWHIDLAMDLTQKKFERLAEAHGYLLLCVNGYSFGFYGAGTPDLLPKPFTPQEQQCLALCEYEPLSSIDAVCGKYSIDRTKIYLCGNSMGGAGTFWLAMRHREMFRAIAPCGALTNSDMNLYDWSPLRDMPTLFVCGTENIGYENVSHSVATLRKHGVDAYLCTVPAAIHDDAWVDALPQIFGFFNRH